MGKEQVRANNALTRDSFTENWFSEEISLVTGLFQLEYDGAWRCVFAAEECHRILCCAETEFLEKLRSLPAVKQYHDVPKTVGWMLDEIIGTEQGCAFISIRGRKEEEPLQYIKGTLSVMRNCNGLLCIYGQISDVSGEQQRDVRSQSVEEQGKANQQIFHIVAQHSNRILYAYDLASGTTRPWDEESRKYDILAHLYTGNYTEDGLEKNKYVLRDSMEDVKKFFADIHSGIPSGDLRIHIRLIDDSTRWYHFKYSSIFHDDKPVTALISVADVTEQHEHELAYKRYVQSIEDDAEGYLLYIESDLTGDRIDKLAGQIIPESERQVDSTHSDFGPLLLDLKYRYDDAEKASAYFACDNLLELYAQGEKLLRSEWKVIFNDETGHWLDTEIVLVEDPYNNHVKALIRMIDVTERQERHLSVQKRADIDAMTGLLRKDVGEERIRAHMASDTEKSGIFIIIDLDDLKGINDTLGHKAGDAAIIGIADTMKSHFRKSDILIRAGGDEFIAFLPGAGMSLSSVELSIERLLKNVSGITVGDKNQRTIHCSAGCAVELKGTDTYDTLFNRADTALYHVKRSGKNTYAVYEPEMSEDDYELKARQVVYDIGDDEKEEWLKHLIEVLAHHYPGIVQLNLSRNRYRIISFNSDAADVPNTGALETLWQRWEDFIHPDDREETAEILSRSNLLALYAKGEHRFLHHYRNTGDWGDVEMEIAINYFRTEEGDICAFAFLRRDIAVGRELELLRLQKALKMTLDPSFEYICLIDVHSKTYSTFTRDASNTHAIPEIADFDRVTKHIRDTLIPEEEREAYYEKAALGNVIKAMHESKEDYSYRYTMMDGSAREVVFSWYEEAHFELLMTVRRLW